MLQLQEDENWNKPTTTTWAAEFLLREGESRELLGSWIRSGAVPEAKKRRAKQVITCSFPCGQWLHMIGARASPRCELCRRERETRGASIDSLLTETVAHIQSAGFLWRTSPSFSTRQREINGVASLSTRSTLSLRKGQRLCSRISTVWPL